MNEMRISQVDGPRRTIVLRGTSLVHVDRMEGGISLGRSQRVKIKYPPGAPVANVQVIGPVYKPLEIEGRWDDKKLANPANSADLIGFPPQPNLLTRDYARQGNAAVSAGVGGQTTAKRARVLAAAMDLLLMEGQMLRVEWASYVRYGYLTEFDPQPIGEETIYWTATFTWTGETNALPKFRKKPQLDAPSVLDQVIGFLNRITDAFNRLAVVAPIYMTLSNTPLGALNRLAVVAPIYMTLSNTPLGALNAAVQELAAAMERFAGALQSRNFLDNVRASFIKVRAAATLLYQTLHRVLGNEDPMTPRAKEEARYGITLLRKEILDLMAAMTERERLLAEISQQPTVLATVIMGEGDTLRSLAAKYYGDQKLWTIIAEYNGLTKSVQPVRTQVFIPEKK
ncbi:MAG TPA: hypothetical protein PKA64_00865 [Myxococcota bacterium]|nr:hypothetical protein [Myxococcota bacterium]